MSGDEFLYSEKPALDQLQSNGWSYKDGRELAPDTSDIRPSLKEVVLSPKLEQGIKRINPWISEENLIKIVENLDINPNKFLNFLQQQDTKDRLKDNTQELVDRGGFGSPTFFLNENKMYFGQDRILLIESQL